MANSVKEVFDNECKHLVIDARFVKRLSAYNLAFVHKNQDHIEFFGNNLTGVQVVRFTDADRDQWFDEILEVNDSILTDQLLKLPDINEDFFVSSDTMNLSCVWLVHAIYSSNKLSPQQKHDAMVDAMLVLQYKFITSRLYRHFRFPADRAVAEATYAQLSYKFAIKTYGSWAAVLNARSEDIIGDESIHRDTIVKMDSDVQVVRMLNDIQGRIRDMLKNIYDVHLRVVHQGNRITSTSAVIEHDGAEVLKDQTKSVVAYGRYLNTIVADKASFVREELVVIIEKMMHTMPPKLFRESLDWMSTNYRLAGAKEIEEILNEVIIHSFDYMSHNRNLVKSTHDLSGLLSKLRGVLMSSRSSDPDLLALREKIEVVVKKATGNKVNSIIASVRTGIYLYLILRAMTKNHYAGS